MSTQPRTRYLPALDGLRAVAVLAVLLYHGDVSWARGGYLGVDAFFVLSGFLITTLLFAEWRARGTIALGAFWARRARRLLPAVFVVLAAVALYAAAWAPVDLLRRLRGDALGALAYVANWRFAVSGESYFEQFATPSPLRHVWSLAIEEQFYLVWPLLFLGLLRLTGGARRVLLATTITLALASSALMVFLFEGGAGMSRVYYGSDTRAQALLAGAALALLLADRDDHGRAPAPRLHAAGLAAAVVLGWIWVRTPDATAWLYRGGFTVTAVLVTVVIASVTRTRPGPLGTVLSIPPLRAVGVISYGLYLWHWPVYIALSQERTALRGATLLAVRLLVTFGAAVLSYVLVEAPIRRGAVRGWRVRALTPVAGAAAAAAFVLVTANVAPDPLGAAVARTGTMPELTSPITSNSPNTPNVVRALLVGDSVALTLGRGFEHGMARRLAVRNGATFGCGLVSGEMLSSGVWRSPSPACESYLDRLRQHVETERPDVVVALWGVWDLFDRRIDGRVLRWGTPEHDEHLMRELENSITTLTSTGASLVLLTSPHYQPPDLAGRPDRVGTALDPSRVDHWNVLLRTVSRAHRGVVRLVDLHARLTPGGASTNSFAGVDGVRSDGIHFSTRGANAVARWLEPRIVEAAPDRPR